MGKARGVTDGHGENKMSYELELIFGHADPLQDLRGDVSQADPTVAGEIYNGAEPADHPLEAFVKAQRHGLKDIVADEDPSWTAPLKPFEKRVEVVDAGYERRASYYDEYGSLVEFKILLPAVE